MAYNRLYNWFLEEEEKTKKEDLERGGLDFVIKDQQKYDRELKKIALINTIMIIGSLSIFLIVCIYKIIKLW